MNKNNRPIVYYAHPFLSETQGIGKLFLWQLQQNLEGWTWLNPFESEYEFQYLRNPKNIEFARKLVEQDLALIDSADLVVVFLPNMIGDEPCYGIGSSQEIFYTRYCKGKPVYAVTPFDHAWFKGLGVIIEPDVFSLINRLKRDYP
ncbi:MAG: hypothetical protein WC365_08075 [Candidatus Babeliales bacterium]|jgi:nucleoside 2-deoxyribosyltransferase